MWPIIQHDQQKSLDFQLQKSVYFVFSEENFVV